MAKINKNLHVRTKGRGIGKPRRNPRKTKMVYTIKRRTGTTNVNVDRKRRALPPGLRRTDWGTLYPEYRKNRSDTGKNKI